MPRFAVHYTDETSHPGVEVLSASERSKAYETVVQKRPSATLVGLEKRAQGEWTLIDGAIPEGSSPMAEEAAAEATEQGSSRGSSRPLPARQPRGEQPPGIVSALYFFGTALIVITCVGALVAVGALSQGGQKPGGWGLVAVFAYAAPGVVSGALIYAIGKIVAQLHSIESLLRQQS